MHCPSGPSLQERISSPIFVIPIDLLIFFYLWPVKVKPNMFLGYVFIYLLRDSLGYYGVFAGGCTPCWSTNSTLIQYIDLILITLWKRYEIPCGLSRFKYLKSVICAAYVIRHIALNDLKLEWRSKQGSCCIFFDVLPKDYTENEFLESVHLQKRFCWI